MISYFITALASLIIGALAAALITNRSKTLLIKENASLQGQLRQKDGQLTQAAEQLRQQRQHSAQETERNRSEVERLQREIERAYQDAERHRQDAEKMTVERLEKMREEIKTVSEQVLIQRQQQIEKTGRDTLLTIADPLMDELKRMQALLERQDKDHQLSISNLNATIRANMEQAKGLGLSADHLAQALRGESKTQGNFGELRLKQLLDNMGFVEGEQYEQQPTLQDENGKVLKTADGHALQPDVILKFPDHRNLIIDSKVSLTAFQDYSEAQTEEEKKDALRRHVASVKRHVQELANKDYASYLKGGGVDFVIMFVFNEGALQLALTQEPHLYEEAWRKKVIICSGSNLYGLLRLLESAWKQQRRLQNEQKLMESARQVVERVQMFRERFLEVERALQKAQDAVNNVKIVTSDGGRSILTATRKMLSYGAEESPKHRSLKTDAQPVGDPKAVGTLPAADSQSSASEMEVED